MKFSIRDLLLVTMIVALALGWWLHHRAWVEAYSTKTHESEIWQARTEAMKVWTKIQIEQSRATPKTSSAAPAQNPPNK